ncbi:hypothetical protein [Nocardia sp. XZ_19_369]|uniref:hypothetical protein n=1 Tax=Nocardia sp. XZ_19_369 TaxID=2769487 RepID=UPI00188F7F5C|nr:hypothetical protein [Nocardia sp. XZ_19_369]
MGNGVVDGVGMNVVGFVISGIDEPALTDVPAESDDGIMQAWGQVFRRRRVPAESVVAIHAEWAPSAADHEFMTRNFPNLGNVTFTFERPEPDGWPAALAHAAIVRETALRRAAAQDLLPAFDADGDQDAPERVLIPMLRMVQLPPPMSASRALIPNQLYLLAARVAPTPRGTLSMSWVLRNQVDSGEVDFDAALAEAFSNLSDGMRIGVGESASGADRLLFFEGTTTTFMPAAAIAMPNFHDLLVEHLGGERFVAGISCHDKLHVVRADSGWVGDLKRMVFADDHNEEDLVPTLLLVERDGISILEQNGTPLI